MEPKRPPWPLNMAGGVPPTQWALYVTPDSLEVIAAMLKGTQAEAILLFRVYGLNGGVVPLIMPANMGMLEWLH